MAKQDRADARDQVTVALPGINIKEALDTFIACLATLPVYKFEDYETSLIYFDFGKHGLTAAARQRLDNLAKYLKADPAVKSVVLEGHTDNIGKLRGNDKLAARRSQAVKDYLAAQGAPADKFSLKSHGERQPAQSNRTNAGRAENRRVTVTLVK